MDALTYRMAMRICGRFRAVLRCVVMGLVQGRVIVQSGLGECPTEEVAVRV